MGLPHIPKWVWWTAIIIVLIALLVFPSVRKETKPLHYEKVAFNLAYQKITFNFQGATTDSYSQFLTSLRNQLKSGEVRGLPVTRKTVEDKERYLLAELKVDDQNSLTLAIDVTDLYIVATLDRYQNKARTNFLKDAPKVARDNLVDKTGLVREIGFKGNYIDLENAAPKGTKRKTIQLGVNKLKSAVESVSGIEKPVSQKEAIFFIISIEMVSEAARFQYIQNKVLEQGMETYYSPDPKALKFENNWGKISQAIHESSKDGTILPSLELVDAKDKPWTVNTVKEIAPDMGILKFKKTKQGY